MILKYKHTNFKERDCMKINEYKINTNFSWSLIEIDWNHWEIKSLTEDRIYFIISWKWYFIVDWVKKEISENDLVFIPKKTNYDINWELKYLLVCSPEFNPKNDLFISK